MGSTGFAAMGKFDGSGIPKISLQPQNGNFIICDGKPYRGYIYLERRENGELLLINYVGTDDYVSSVLGKEMSYSWPIEALKAQAVCARNFVLCRGNVHKGYGFDVCATTHCQVYGGVESEHENTRRAVNETKGVLAKYNGQVVALYFFATSGGKTESVENVWGRPYGYRANFDRNFRNTIKTVWEKARFESAGKKVDAGTYFARRDKEMYRIILAHPAEYCKLLFNKNVLVPFQADLYLKQAEYFAEEFKAYMKEPAKVFMPFVTVLSYVVWLLTILGAAWFVLLDPFRNKGFALLLLFVSGAFYLLNPAISSSIRDQILLLPFLLMTAGCGLAFFFETVKRNTRGKEEENKKKVKK